MTSAQRLQWAQTWASVLLILGGAVLTMVRQTANIVLEIQGCKPPFEVTVPGDGQVGS